MAGILNSKERILDTIITKAGRSQMARGKLQVEFASFTDAGTFYELEIVSGSISGSSDASNRICFEAFSVPQDQVTFESDTTGLLSPFPNENNISVVNGRIFLSGSNSSEPGPILSGSQFEDAAHLLLGSTIDNFKKLQVIASPDVLDLEHNQFILSHNEVSFQVTDSLPIPLNNVQTLRIEHVESFFMDKRLSHIANFQHLPPKNKTGAPLGFFPKLNQAPYLTFDQLNEELQQLSKAGFEQVVEFTETSRPNHIMGQFFEIRNNDITKLDVIDFGIFHTDDPLHPTKHVFFAGKVFTDAYNTHTFVNMFTLVFE